MVNNDVMKNDLKSLASDLEGMMDTALMCARDEAVKVMEFEFLENKKGLKKALRRYSGAYSSYLAYRWSLRRINMILEEPYKHLD